MNNKPIKPKMAGLQEVDKLRRYLDYVERHLYNIASAWIEVQEKCFKTLSLYDDFRFFNMHYAIEQHDVSKLCAEEFTQYAAHFHSGKELKGDKERAAYEKAWDHHKRQNNHHWENWTVSPHLGYDPFYLGIVMAHMVVDWLAMSYEFNDTPREYYESHKDEIKIPKTCLPLLYRLLNDLDGLGLYEEETKKG